MIVLGHGTVAGSTLLSGVTQTAAGVVAGFLIGMWRRCSASPAANC